MLGVDALNLVMMVAESGMIDSSITEILSRPQFLTAAKSNPNIKPTIKNHILKWSSRVKHKMTKVCETERIQDELALYQEVIYWSESEFYTNVDDVVAKLRWHSAFYVEAKELVNNNKGLMNPMFPRFFCERWYQSLSDSIKKAQITELKEDKEKLLADLYQRIETLKTMESVTAEGDDTQIGKLWDMASAKLTKSNVDIMKLHARFLKKNKGLQDIASKLGRMANDVQDPNLSQGMAEEVKVIEEKSDFVTDDIVGIKEGDDLSRLLPNETLFLSHPELEVIFYQHLVDKRLMNYRMEGADRKLRKITTQSRASGDVMVDKGPFVVCVDASGSMSGFPEQCAKALAYGLMQIALAEGRDCYVILFSTQQITYELSKQDGLKEVADFLSYQFHGGTDLEPVLEQSIELMRGDKYKNADLVVLSDFIAPTHSERIDGMVEELKKHQNRFHAVCLSKYGNPALMEMFDHTWSYHPSMLGRLTQIR
ncbi:MULTISPECIES: ATPase RavA stimulator ViaA [Aliivibrio]|uniref:Protein viaA n=1 Tax=Aliivibrio logei TaxID=688 RepID=A0A1B9NU02_ALILO|nr:MULTISPECIES: ATPase RavA stimulator ViaA [Aliivibrio]MBB1315071.1 ATPase RavA stimulator ViaA [Aliivibrio sp. SR45-2]OCH17178.1 protein viaA [Aliivibrio logei]